MCEHGDIVQCCVFIPEHLSHTRRARWAWKSIDRCIAPIVDALNAKEVLTMASCCGHGKGRGEIVLHDGRTLYIESSPSIGPLSPLRHPAHYEDAEGETQ